jgi:hypothetical protein|tara:strand:- start:6 stop:1109 length:1104 start_codon:yes stop_codon:yes gene_type:complete
MTVSALTTRNDITATPGQTSFTYTFMVLESSDMTVYQNGALLASGYTITGVGVSTGGTVVLDTGALTGQIVSLVLAMPLDRTTNYQNSGDFLASDVNSDFDKIYIGAIQNENWIDRSIRLQPVEPAGFDLQLSVAALRANKLLGFDSTGALEEIDYLKAQAVTILTAETFTGDGTTTAFTLIDAPVVAALLQITIDGIMQVVSSYSLSGLVVTFSEAPPLNALIEVRKFLNNTDVIGDITAVVAGTGLSGGGTEGNVTLSIANDGVGADQLASVPVAVGITSVVTATSLTATVNTHVYVSAATKTITLPASPTIGQRVLLTVGNFTDTVIARNGSNIMSLAADFTMDSAYLSIQFIYTDATQGWVMS